MTLLLNLIMTLITLVTYSSLSGINLYCFMFTLITTPVNDNFNNGVVIRRIVCD
jgi:hypothetical protein